MNRVKVCPFCKGTRVSHDTSNPLEGPLGLPERFVCADCGHVGYAFPEMPKKSVAAYKKKTGVHTTARTKKKPEFSWGGPWSASGPAAIVLGLLLLTVFPVTGMFVFLLGVAFFWTTRKHE